MAYITCKYEIFIILTITYYINLKIRHMFEPFYSNPRLQRIQTVNFSVLYIMFQICNSGGEDMHKSCMGQEKSSLIRHKSDISVRLYMYIHLCHVY